MPVGVCFAALLLCCFALQLTWPSGGRPGHRAAVGAPGLGKARHHRGSCRRSRLQRAPPGADGQPGVRGPATARRPVPAESPEAPTCLRMLFMTLMKPASSLASSRAASFFSVFFLPLFSTADVAILLRRCPGRPTDRLRRTAPGRWGFRRPSRLRRSQGACATPGGRGLAVAGRKCVTSTRRAGALASWGGGLKTDSQISAAGRDFSPFG